MQPILIVDDEVEMRIAMSETLKHSGYSVELSHNALDAIKKFKNNGHSLVITDMTMPKRSGLDLLKDRLWHDRNGGGSHETRRIRLYCQTLQLRNLHFRGGASPRIPTLSRHPGFTKIDGWRDEVGNRHAERKYDEVAESFKKRGSQQSDRHDSK